MIALPKRGAWQLETFVKFGVALLILALILSFYNRVSSSGQAPVKDLLADASIEACKVSTSRYFVRLSDEQKSKLDQDGDGLLDGQYEFLYDGCDPCVGGGPDPQAKQEQCFPANEIAQGKKQQEMCANRGNWIVDKCVLI